MGATWSIGVGIFIYFIATIVAIVWFVLYRKLSIILYTASITTLIFSIFYMIDVFDFNRHLVLLTLVLSTIIFFILGKYFKNITYERVKPNSESLKVKF